LTAAKLKNTPATRAFLTDWHANVIANCRNNPVEISHTARGATHCTWLTPVRDAKNYTSPAQASTAFAAQLRGGAFPALLAALESAVPLDPPNPDAVLANLRKWGSVGFSAWLEAEIKKRHPPGQPPPAPLSLPHVHKGWAALRKSVNVRLPHSLHQAERLRKQALRTAGNGGRVGR
jgi:hypothetical protein